MAAKTLVKKRIQVLSLFIMIIPTHLMVPANFLGVEFQRTTSKLKKNPTIFHHGLFKSSINHEVWHFPLLAVQWPQMKFKKGAVHTKLLFCFLTLLLFDVTTTTTTSTWACWRTAAWSMLSSPGTDWTRRLFPTGKIWKPLPKIWSFFIARAKSSL